MENCPKCTYGRVYGGPEKIPPKVGAGVQKIYKTKNICSIVPFLVNYLDNNITSLSNKYY